MSAGLQVTCTEGPESLFMGVLRYTDAGELPKPMSMVVIHWSL